MYETCFVSFESRKSSLIYHYIISGSIPAGTQIFSLFQCKLKTSELLLTSTFTNELKICHLLHSYHNNIAVSFDVYMYYNENSQE